MDHQPSCALHQEKNNILIFPDSVDNYLPASYYLVIDYHGVQQL